ncbi:hypothetical protein DACRYDRAFT_75668 [Dacryopinax primogenitus]|uniref:IucC family-domain-containing protein n=1 Tax=Dacryopinax primogenitus (strain DJM 731) TaxID=1858805 RepID=M5G7P2_DACPD|nr:uncharacterized protein DACRYDRAFT_75668 [Dacryopinax primogenitus]EJU04764.1 hypothetical protein DACRYDRAFT_75668 [Dacryopinax primogenitus]
MQPLSSFTLTNLQWANHAVASRIITCIVLESLLQALFVPSEHPEKDGFVGLCVLLGPNSKVHADGNALALGHKDVYAIVPLRSLPVLSPKSQELPVRRILLIDPLEMFPYVYTFQPQIADTGDAAKLGHKVLDCLQASIRTSVDNEVLDHLTAVQLWEKFALMAHVEADIAEELAEEFGSSVEWQAYSYDHPAVIPTLQSPSIKWEQTILEGHPTHPMNKARKSLPPMPVITPGSYDFLNPTIRIMRVPRRNLKLRGEFENIFEPMVQAAEKNAGQTLTRTSNFVLMPVHELQLPNIKEKFPENEVLGEEFSVKAESLTSTRSVLIPEVLRKHSLKLCVSMKISSALRTVTPWTCFVGNEFTHNILPKLHYDRTALVVEGEVASAVSNNPDFSIAKHCSTVVRESYELYSEKKNERVIVCTALTEKIQRPDTDITQAEHVFGLDTDEKRVAFLDRYVKIAVAAFLPPLLIDGVAFEAHGQNTMTRFDMTTGELVGFAIRDFGGIKVHQPTLERSIGQRLAVLPDDAVGTEDLNDCFKLLHHTLIHVHIHRLIRVLGLHEDGRGWAIVRKYLDAAIPQDHALRKAWLSEEAAFVPAKCFIKMKMTELYRDYIYSPIPNLIQYKPQEA